MHILAARVIAYFGVTGFWLRFFTQTNYSSIANDD
jgi:hypothetical protein